MVHQQPRQLNKTIKFEMLAKKLCEELENEIAKHHNDVGKFSSEKQLERIKDEIKIMLGSNSSKDFIPSFPRIIVDSWDYNNKIGMRLLDFFELYKEIK